MRDGTAAVLVGLVERLTAEIDRVERNISCIPFRQRFDTNTLLDRTTAIVSYRRGKEGWGLWYLANPDAQAVRLVHAPIRVRLAFYKNRQEFVQGYLEQLEQLRQELEEALPDGRQGEET